MKTDENFTYIVLAILGTGLAALIAINLGWL